MTVPLVVLAVLAGSGELLNLPFTPDLHVLQHWLEPVVGANEVHIDVATNTKVALAIVAMAASFLGIFGAWLVYLRHKVRAVEPSVLAHAWYYDESITRFVGGPGSKGFEAVAWFDRNVIDGAVNGVATLVRSQRPGPAHGADRLRPLVCARHLGRCGRRARLLPHEAVLLMLAPCPRERGRPRRPVVRHPHHAGGAAGDRRAADRADAPSRGASCTAWWRCCSPAPPPRWASG